MREFKPSFRYENQLKKRFPAAFFAAIPEKAGVYFMRDAGGEILYVGKAKSLRARLSSYRNAKPGQVGENIIELLDKVSRIDWEEHASEDRAIRRENELIHALTPPFNIADCWEEHYFFIGIREAPAGKLTFKLTSHELGTDPFAEGYELFGCFANRVHVKRGYSALLRILYASLASKPRFSFPSRITRVSPAYDYRFPLAVPRRIANGLRELLRGRSEAVLGELLLAILENECVPEFARPGLLEDLALAREFYERCARRDGRGRALLISHEQMRKRIRSSI